MAAHTIYAHNNQLIQSLKSFQKLGSQDYNLLDLEIITNNSS